MASNRPSYEAVRALWFLIFILNYEILVFCFQESSDSLQKDSNFIEENFQDLLKSRSRTKRTVLSLPKNTSCKLTFDWATDIKPLNNTRTSLTLTVPFRFVLPSYTDLQAFYSSLGNLFGKSDDELSEADKAEPTVDAEVQNFIEQQRSKRHRRAVYKNVEATFRKYVQLISSLFVH